ncbi:MAG: hypothetical protein IPM29_03275 [Planctomycetes bacterium]|nr:hypothetical protein [Planctomycetota bacterium]
MKLPHLCLGIAAVAALASTQTIVVPAGMANSNPGSTTLGWRNTNFRFQMLYDESHFLSQGINYPIVINRLQYRASGGQVSAGGDTYSGVTVQMSSSPSDWSAPSMAFASNVGGDVTTVFTGTITCLAAAGNPSPNTYIIDIPLGTPFVYDPTSGLDLVIDVDAPNAPIPAGVPSMASSSNASHLARRLSTTTAGAATGALSYFTCVVMLDYTRQPNAATATSYGDGCVAKAQSFYETFTPGAFDLAGRPGSPNSIALIPLGRGYVVARGSNAWFTPTSVSITLGDDELTTPITLPFTLSYPGGSATDILVCSNGFVYLDTAQTSTSARGSGAGLVTFGPRFAPLWNDLDPSAGGSVHVDQDPVTSAFYVTWDQVPLFGNLGALNTIQLAIFPDNHIEYRYQACQNADGIVGWSPGNNARDPGDIDISASLPFATDVDTAPLSLGAVNRPKLGASFTLEAGDFPAGASLAAMSFGIQRVNPPVDLGVIGAPKCYQNASIEAAFGFMVTGATQRFSLPIPSNTALAGQHLYAQAVSTAPTSNPLGIATSNGLDMLLDLN